MSEEAQLVKDPVCGMKIQPSEAVASIEHEGTTYYFCSQDCADSFRESPADYVEADRPLTTTWSPSLRSASRSPSS